MKNPDTAALQSKIRELKEQRNAVLLAHNYQLPEIQEVADFVGDSLELCREAQRVESEAIVFCGVDFMAQSACILNPDKTVIHPNTRARCPMAAQLSVKTLVEAKNAYPSVPVVLYVNTFAEAKAECDVTCTSANAVEVIKRLGSKKIIFGPDWNLGYYVKKRLPDVELIPVPDHGFCNTHRLFRDVERAKELKRQYSDAELLVHPECEPGFQETADSVLSTGGMYRYCDQGVHHRDGNRDDRQASQGDTREDLHPRGAPCGVSDYEANHPDEHIRGPEGHGAGGDCPRGYPDQGVETHN